ncbi:MAG: molybdopterin-dependent oxidoreductase, partial [Acidimicrobiia bacterium]|nr:molybdopterin-dependent oxidoreductase [Acidimicrobiia bacterium]
PASRRAFLAWAGAGSAFAALAAGAGTKLRGRGRVEAARGALVLPPPAVPAPPAPAGLAVAGLSTRVTPNADFYRIDTALLVPRVDPGGWRLRVTGLVEAELEMTLDHLLAEDLVEEEVTLACVSNEIGGDLVGNARWLGLPLGPLLERARPTAEASQVVGRSVDGFTAGFPLEAARDGRTALLAVGMNGEPLPIPHGFPARLVVAGLYGYVSATKWLSEIELTRWEDYDAFWVPRGWSKEGPVKTQSRIDVPRARASVPAGQAVVAGVAWAPARGISAVEVQVDEEPWQRAELGGAPSEHTWVQWRWAWEAAPGHHVLRARATDGDGVAQTPERTRPDPDGASGWHTVEVEVTDRA